MGPMMHGVYRRSANPTVSVPAPWDSARPSKLAWYDRLAQLAPTLGQTGFRSLLLPPSHKTSAGNRPEADGYGTYDDYDIGEKAQFYSVATRFGTGEELRRCVAVLAACGIDAYLDIVFHQRSGGMGGEYKYLGSDGKTYDGRFPKHRAMFRGDTRFGWAPQDPVAAPADDYPFGDEFSPIHNEEAARGLIAAGIWLFKTTGARGARLDDMKGMAPAFVRRYIREVRAACGDIYFFGEYADGNPDSLGWWVNDSGMERSCSVQDFAFHYRAKDMCEGPGRWDMRQLRNMGYASRDPTRAQTFVENQDSDTNGFGQIAFNKAQAYLCGLTREGDLSVYIRDWLRDDGCYGAGMQDSISNYCWIAHELAEGPTVWRHEEYQCAVFERQGKRKLLVGVNNDPSPWWKRFWVETGFGPNVHLHDYTGHAGDLWTNQDGWVYLSLPPNVNGLGTVAYSVAGQDREIRPAGRSIVQVFAGAHDLPLGPLVRDKEVRVARIWVAGGTRVDAALTTLGRDWEPSDEVLLSVRGPGDFNFHAGLDLTQRRASTRTTLTQADGWHEVWLELDTAEVAQADFELTLTYTAPRHI